MSESVKNRLAMPNPASSKFRERCKILSNEKVAPGHFILKIASKKISPKCQPGQFVQICLTDQVRKPDQTWSDGFEPLLPRPFSFLTATKTDFSILYHVIGKGTKALSQKKKGDELWILGPLGNGFTIDQRPEIKRTRSENLKSAVSSLQSQVLLVGGGVGIPPLYHLAQQLVQRTRSENLTGPGPVVHVFLGARDKSLLLCEKEFQKLKVNLKVATDNGSKGLKGLVTQLLEVQLDRTRSGKPMIYTCGPTPMLKAVSSIAQKYEVPCEVSVEVPMACGFGACLGCAIKVRPQTADNRLQTKTSLQSPVSSLSSSSSYRYAIACCEGPVFPGNTILWE